MKYFIFLANFLSFLSISAGFDGKTLIKTDNNFCPIEAITLDHTKAFPFSACTATFLGGQLIALNPVAVLIGATLLLSSFDYLISDQNFEEKLSTTIPFIPERNYYEIQQKKLIDLWREFAAIAIALQALPILPSLSHLLQAKPTAWQTVFKPDAKTEARYTQAQKENLRSRRKAELSLLEEEINDMQQMIVFHFVEHVTQMQEALADLSEASQKNFAIVTQKNPSYKTIQESDQQAFESYDILLTRSSLINAFNTIFYYFKFLISFYDNPANAIVIKKTTNIIEVLLQLKTQLTEVLQWISRAQECNQINTVTIENYFKSRGIIDSGDKGQNQKREYQRKAKKDAQARNRFENFKQQNNNNNTDKKIKQVTGITAAKKVKDETKRIVEKYANTNYFLKESALGKNHANDFQRVKKSFHNERAFQATKDINSGIKKAIILF